MVHGLLGGETLVGVPLQQQLEEVDDLRRVPVEHHLHRPVRRRRRQAVQREAGEGRLEGGDVTRERLAQHQHEEREHVDGGGPREQRLLTVHLRGDAAQAPGVHRRAVAPRAQQQLWRPVPSRRGVVRHDGPVPKSQFLRRRRASPAEVRECDPAGRVDQDVGGLHVPVHHPSRVDVLQRAQQLVCYEGPVDRPQGLAAERLLQVGVHQVRDDVEVPVVGGAQHVVDPQDVRVVPELQEVGDLPVRPLRVRGVPESVQHLLEGQAAAPPLARGLRDLPDDAVEAAPYLLPDGVAAGHVPVDALVRLQLSNDHGGRGRRRRATTAARTTGGHASLA
mmetsp:Transcript_16216/g.50996  ORF Transcript_16216/g.50996 Transcript_16216/m.50996 type:complete len:335 (-) Transcript_16216:9-1013(-)